MKGFGFDLEGTTVNVEYAHHKGFCLAAAEAGIPLSYPEEIFRKVPSLVGGTYETISREIAVLSGEKKDNLEKLANYIAKRTRVHYKELLKTIEIKPRPGFLGVLSRLRRKKFKVMIGTSTSFEKADYLVRAAGLYQFFKRKDILFAEDVKNAKPAPDVWQKMATIMEIECAQLVVFEDGVRGITSVKNAGAIPIAMPLFNKPAILKQLLDAGAVRIFMDWREMNIMALIKNLEKLS